MTATTETGLPEASSPSISVEKELKKSYLDYAMSVIVGRALPDVRDGLKPVHRRVLYAMREIGVFYNRPYVKSARIVGDVMYLVSHQNPWFYRFGSEVPQDATLVFSVQIGDANEVEIIDVKEFPRNGWQHHVYVNQDTIFLASTRA